MAGVIASEATAHRLGDEAERLVCRHAQEAEVAPARTLQQAAFPVAETSGGCLPGPPEELRVLVRDAGVVSCLSVVRLGLYIRGAHFPMGGIRHVVTHPDEQRQGYASRLLQSSLRSLWERSVPVSVLFPFSFRYYRKFGYELGGNHYQFWCRSTCIPTYAERRWCREAGAVDAGTLAQFYGRIQSSAALSVERDPNRWRRICTAPDLTVLAADRDGLQGYAVVQETRDPYGGRLLKVMDMAAQSPLGWRALLGRLASCGAEAIEWGAGLAALSGSGLLRATAPLREGFKPLGIVTVRPMFQLRVVHLRAALDCAAAFCPPGPYRLAVRLRDELLPENEQAWTLQGTTAGAEVRPARSTDPYVMADVRVFSQLLCGYLSPEEAHSQGLLRGSSATALEVAERLFPAGEPFIPELDRF